MSIFNRLISGANLLLFYVCNLSCKVINLLTIENYQNYYFDAIFNIDIYERDIGFLFD